MLLFDFFTPYTYIYKNKKIYMKTNKIKNTHNEMISLFVKKNGVEQQVHILPGHSIVVDAYETKTMRVFAKRGFIEVQPAQLMSSDSFAWLGDSQEKLDKQINVAPEELVELSEEDMKNFQKNLMAELTLEENPDRFEVRSKEGEPTILEIIEGEVEQYVEGGFVKGEWTEEDLIFLKKNYPTKGRKYCSTHLNRNESSVQKKINALGLKKKKKKK